MFTRQVKSFLMLEISIFTSSFAFTQNPLTAIGVLRDDLNRAVNAISKDLDVTPDLFRPALATSIQPPRGAIPEGNQKHANETLLLDCLQKANASITNDGLNKIMDSYWPGGRAAQ
jgi:hypothetical protein